MAKAQEGTKRSRSKKVAKPEVSNPGSFTRANSVGQKVRELIMAGKKSVDKQELIKEADKLYASVKGKRQNPSEATWLTKQVMGAIVGLGLAEDSNETLFFKPSLIKALKN